MFVHVTGVIESCHGIALSVHSCWFKHSVTVTVISVTVISGIVTSVIGNLTVQYSVTSLTVLQHSVAYVFGRRLPSSNSDVRYAQKLGGLNPNFNP